MQHYELLSGKHYEKGPGGIAKFAKGDVVKSPQDLRKQFPNKFKLVEEPLELKLKSLGQGKYNVVDASGEVLNDEPLTKADAEKFVSEKEID